jgi:hypothetical protein
MIFISHRGNIEGPSELENHPTKVTNALELGFKVEIDVWKIEESLFCGHDFPEFKISLDWLKTIKNDLFIHCKNLDALQFFSNQEEDWIFFWHQEDDFTLTSNLQIWTYPGKVITKDSIAVMPEKIDYNLDELFIAKAICTDYPIEYSKKFKHWSGEQNEKS